MSEPERYNGAVISLWGRIVYCFLWLNGWFWSFILFRLRVKDAKYFPSSGGVLLACNHVSHLDPPLLCLALNRVLHHMAKKELFEPPWLLWLLTTIRTILVDRGKAKQALIDAVDYLGKGACVAIFPEGTRSTNGRLGKGRSGAIILAIRSGCPIVPTVIMGSEKAMTKGSKRINFVPITIRFGEPYVIEYDGDPETVPSDVLRRETFQLMERIENLLPEKMQPLPKDKAAWYSKVIND